jgi:hypothetical protein
MTFALVKGEAVGAARGAVAVRAARVLGDKLFSPGAMHETM